MLELDFCSTCGYDFEGPLQILQAIEGNGGPHGLDLSKKDLSGIDLSRDVVQMELNRARRAQSGANPPWWARFGGINLAGANLQGADLFRANLARAFLQDADLAGANLRRAVLTEAFLGSAKLQEADLSEANLQMAYMADADLRGANLLHANLEGASMSNANLRGAKVADVRQLAVARSLAGAISPEGTRLSRVDWRRELDTWRHA